METNIEDLPFDYKLLQNQYKEEVRKNKILMFMVLFLFMCILALCAYCFTLESNYNDMVTQVNTLTKILENSIQLI